jgi:hypothetical protein
MPLDPSPAAAAGQPATDPGKPQTITIPVEQFQEFAGLQARISQLEQEQKQRETAATEERIKLMTAKGEAEAAVKTLREQKEAELAAEKSARIGLEDRAKRYALDGELSRALASQPLVAGGAEQLTKLWRSEFTAEPQGDSFAVRTPTFQSVGDFVAAQLTRPEYAHFVRAQNPGGGTGAMNPAGQSAPTQPANSAAPPQPKTLSEAVILTMQERAKGTIADGRINPAVGFGLRPTARSAAGG